MSIEYHPGKIKPIIKTVASILGQDPSLQLDDDRLIEKVEDEIPELKDKKNCANCGASMTQYAYNLNVIDVALVISMAKAVREATRKDISFTEANKVHVPTLPVSDAVRHKTTRCAKLGLIAKYLFDGRQVKGIWVITKRGFEALRGEEIPTGIIVWRGHTIERPDSMTTFAQIQAGYKQKIDNQKKDKPADNYHYEIMNYRQSEWIDFAGFHDGKLF